MKILILIFITFFSLFCHADTIDYWSVYLNDSLIGEYNSTTKNKTLVIKKELIQSNDEIFIVYWNDQPCSQCEYYFAVKDKISGVKLHVERSGELLNQVSFSLLKLKDFPISKEFKFIVYEYGATKSNDSYTLLLNFKIE